MDWDAIRRYEMYGEYQADNQPYARPHSRTDRSAAWNERPGNGYRYGDMTPEGMLCNPTYMLTIGKTEYRQRYREERNRRMGRQHHERDQRQQREYRDHRDHHDHHDQRGHRGHHENREHHEQRDHRENRDQREHGNGRRERGKRESHSGVGRLPARWISYAAMGAEVSGTPFLPFKTPLRPEFNDKLSKDGIFQVETLLSCVSTNNRRIGLVIDLTNTDRYYNPRIWLDHGIQHTKIKNYGQDVHLQPDLFERFKSIVDAFMYQNKDSDLLIGVHCTHGLNRTGYLICRYMIEVLKVNAKEAIREFERSRGYVMERDAYVNALKEIAASLQSEAVDDDWADMTAQERRESLKSSRKQSWLEIASSHRVEDDDASDESKQSGDSITQ